MITIGARPLQLVEPDEADAVREHAFGRTPSADAEDRGPVDESPESAERPWPAPPGAAAFSGLAGELVNAVVESTEADPVALLGSILAIFGALAGRSRGIYQGSYQGANLYIVLVGETSVGRKGTSWGVGRSIFDAAQPGWTSLLVPGLGSGEGLVSYIRRKREAAEEGRRQPDLRALLFESEYGRLLAVANREGSTLSPVLRDAWDGSPLGRFIAQGGSVEPFHHVGLLGHITPTELRVRLNDSDAANGYGNRHLWLLVRRQRLLAFPENPVHLVTPYLAALRSAIDEWCALPFVESDNWTSCCCLA